MFKKGIKWLLASGMMLSMIHAPVVNAQAETYEGTSPGMQGPITAKITVEDGKITKISFPENSETVSVTRTAFERIPTQIIDHQSLNMDAVTGATLTSNAIIRAVGQAAEEAGLDVDAMKENEVVPEPAEDQVIDTDILVVGGGGAGFSAAITAAQEGANVHLIEKSSFLGGEHPDGRGRD